MLLSNVAFSVLNNSISNKGCLTSVIISLSNHGFQHKAKVITANIYPSDSKITLFLGILCESD